MQGKHVFLHYYLWKNHKNTGAFIFCKISVKSGLGFMLWSNFINDQEEIIKSLLRKFVNGLKIERVVNNK